MQNMIFYGFGVLSLYSTDYAQLMSKKHRSLCGVTVL